MVCGRTVIGQEIICRECKLKLEEEEEQEEEEKEEEEEEEEEGLLTSNE